MKKTIVSAVATLATLISPAAFAATISISTFSIADFNAKTGVSVIENFETRSESGVLSGPLSSKVGTFSSAGGSGDGGNTSTCVSNGGCVSNLALQIDTVNGQGNLVPTSGTRSLNSNDTFGIIWDVALRNGRAFKRVVFALRDGGEFQELTVSSGGASQSYGPGTPNNNGKLFVIDFANWVTSAKISMVNPVNDDGFTIDGATIAQLAPVPLPASALMLFGGVAALGAAKRRRKKA